MDNTKIKTGEAENKKAGNLGDNFPNTEDNLLRMGAAAVSGLDGNSTVEEMSSGGTGFMAIGGSEGYTGAETSGGGADPYDDDEGSGTGSGYNSGNGGSDADGNSDNSQQVDTTVDTGKLNTDDDTRSGSDKADSEAGGIGAP